MVKESDLFEYDSDLIRLMVDGYVYVEKLTSQNPDGNPWTDYRREIDQVYLNETSNDRINGH